MVKASVGDIAHEFFARVACPSQDHINALLIDLAIPVMALAHDGDGDGFAIGVANIEKCGRRFEFVTEGGIRAVVIVARDEDGEPADLVAWLPHEGWAGPWLDNMPLLGMHELVRPRLGDPLPVFLRALDWLRAGREGVVVLDAKRAWLALEGVTIAAASFEDAVEFSRILERPKPKIVIPAVNLERVAA